MTVSVLRLGFMQCLWTYSYKQPTNQHRGLVAYITGIYNTTVDDPGGLSFGRGRVGDVTQRNAPTRAHRTHSQSASLPAWLDPEAQGTPHAPQPVRPLVKNRPCGAFNRNLINLIISWTILNEKCSIEVQQEPKRCYQREGWSQDGWIARLACSNRVRSERLNNKPTWVR
jgi:hypothetical protein